MVFKFQINEWFNLPITDVIVVLEIIILMRHWRSDGKLTYTMPFRRTSAFHRILSLTKLKRSQYRRLPCLKPHTMSKGSGRFFYFIDGTTIGGVAERCLIVEKKMVSVNLIHNCFIILEPATAYQLLA